MSDVGRCGFGGAEVAVEVTYLRRWYGAGEKNPIVRTGGERFTWMAGWCFFLLKCGSVGLGGSLWDGTGKLMMCDIECVE